THLNAAADPRARPRRLVGTGASLAEPHSRDAGAGTRFPKLDHTAWRRLASCGAQRNLRPLEIMSAAEWRRHSAEPRKIAITIRPTITATSMLPKSITSPLLALLGYAAQGETSPHPLESSVNEGGAVCVKFWSSPLGP